MTRISCYITLTEDEIIILDTVTAKLGYANRTELVTSLLRSLIYAKAFRKNTQELNGILTVEPEISSLQENFLEVLDEYAFPVIAMHGPDYAFKALSEDFKVWMYQKCRAVPQESDMKEWVRLYYTIKKGDIIRYRIAQTTAQFAEELEEKENEAYV